MKTYQLFLLMTAIYIAPNLSQEMRGYMGATCLFAALVAVIFKL